MLGTISDIPNRGVSLELEADELLLIEDTQRYVLFPIKYQPIFNIFKEAQSSYWTVEELHLAGDIDHWDKLSEDEQSYLKQILAFFAGVDSIVGEHINFFYDTVQIPEVRLFYGFQLMIEGTHAESYARMIISLIKDTEERAFLFNAIENCPTIKKLSQWASKWIKNPNMSFAEKIISTACIEGIMFSGKFASIFWIKEKGLMPGLTQANQLIMRDENLHCEFACLLYNHYIKHKPSHERVLEIVTEAVDFEIEFIRESLPKKLVGMNAELMEQYIKFVADRLLQQLGYEPHYNTANPFRFLEKISLKTKTNFFEKISTDYSLSGFEGAQKATNAHGIQLIDDF